MSAADFNWGVVEDADDEDDARSMEIPMYSSKQAGFCHRTENYYLNNFVIFFPHP